MSRFIIMDSPKLKRPTVVLSLHTDNSHKLELNTIHDINCPFLEDLFPDLVKDDQAVQWIGYWVLIFFYFSYTKPIFLRSALVDEMH